MTPATVELLASGKAFVDVSSRRAVTVSGTQVVDWLNDLVSARVDDLAPSRARRSLLLSPTGSVLAEFTVTVIGGTLVLIQDPRQPDSVADLLAPYVLSADVQLEDRTGEHAIFAFPGRTAAPDSPGTAWSTPSCIGADGGVDVVSLAEDHDRLAVSLGKGYVHASEDDAEAWRIFAKIAAVGVDTADGDLPAECLLDDAVSFDKGCFLGQEAVARARNLGHPRRWLVPIEAIGEMAPGESVLAGDAEVGVVTSAAWIDGRTLALARIRWEQRDEPLHTTSGVELRRRMPG